MSILRVRNLRSAVQSNAVGKSEKITKREVEGTDHSFSLGQVVVEHSNS